MYYEAGKLSQPILIINILNYPIQNINNLLMIALSNLFKVSLLLNILLKSKGFVTLIQSLLYWMPKLYGSHMLRMFTYKKALINWLRLHLREWIRRI